MLAGSLGTGCDRNVSRRIDAARLTERWRRLHESLTFIPDHRGVIATDSPRPTGLQRPALPVFVPIAAAFLLLAGCGTADPSTRRPTAAPGATAPAGSTPSSPPGAAEAGANPIAATVRPDGPTASAPAALQPVAAPAATKAVPTSVAPAPETDQSLADIDRALADLDSQLSDADRDVATPEGDLR